MKTLTILNLMAFLLSSCFNKINNAINHDSINSMKESKEGSGVYVITKDGKKITGSSIEVVSSHAFSGSGNVKLDGTVYRIADLAHVQTNDVYATNFNNNWYKRIAKGKIEAYIFSYQNGSTTMYECLLQKNGQSAADYTTNNLYDLISDNSTAIKTFNETYGNKHSDKVPWDNQYKHLLHVLNSYN